MLAVKGEIVFLEVYEEEELEQGSEKKNGIASLKFIRQSFRFFPPSVSNSKGGKAGRGRERERIFQLT